MNAAEANGLLEAAERLVADGQRLRTALEWEFLSKQITEVNSTKTTTSAA